MSEDRSDWGREFEEPIALPDGRKLIVLRDAASYITALPKKESDAPEWQAAIEALMLVAQLGGPTMFARIGMMQALNRPHAREFTPQARGITRGGESSRGINDGGCKGWPAICDRPKYREWRQSTRSASAAMCAIHTR